MSTVALLLWRGKVTVAAVSTHIVSPPQAPATSVVEGLGERHRARKFPFVEDMLRSANHTHCASHRLAKKGYFLGIDKTLVKKDSFGSKKKFSL